MHSIQLPRRVGFKVATKIRIMWDRRVHEEGSNLVREWSHGHLPKEFLGKTAYLVIMDQRWFLRRKERRKKDGIA